VSSTQIAVLGAIAGFTIYLGLPIGRLRSPLPKLRALLNATATGILIFLLWDVLTHAWAPIDGALSHHRYGSATGNGLVFALCFGVGLVGLVYFDRWIARRSARAFGPGAASAAELEVKRSGLSRLADLPMMIAIGIGLHNFAEGLAIGNSAAHGELQLAVLLVIGFGLHNATEGFGIVAPMAAEGRRPSWR
jgi:ZIP family zinc transporter